jgi:hydrogenase maturation protease
MNASVLVVGFGNPLMGDDGAGPAVAQRLRSETPELSGRVEEGGTDATHLALLWRGEPDVWLIDAAILGAAPGTVHRLPHAVLLRASQAHGGAHRLSLPECLRWLAQCEPGMAAVRFRLWGIEPQVLAPGRAGLSPAVSRAVASVASEIASRLGHRSTVARREPRARTVHRT